MSPVVDKIMLQILLSHVADHGSALDMQYYSDSVISGKHVMCVCVCVCLFVCLCAHLCL